MNNYLRGGNICSSTVLQTIDRHQLRKAADVLAEGFMQDPLYQHMVPDEAIRLPVLRIFFKQYLSLLYPYSDIYTTSERFEAIAVVFRSERMADTRLAHLRYGMEIVAATLKSIPAIRHLGVRGFIRGLNILHTMSSAWLSRLEDQEYLHLDMLVVQPRYRGQGFVTAMLGPILAECRARKLPCTLETQSMNNVAIYEHYRFEQVDSIPLPNSKLEMYCMIYSPYV